MKKFNIVVILSAIWFITSIVYTAISAAKDNDTQIVGINLVDVSLFASLITLGLVAVLNERNKNLAK